MRLQRFIATAALSALLWPLALGGMNSAFLEYMRGDPMLSVVLIGSLYVATLLAIWISDTFTNWSSGELALADKTTRMTRIRIACVTALIQSYFLTRMFKSMGAPNIKYSDVLFTQGVCILGTAWLATIITDLILRK